MKRIAIAGFILLLTGGGVLAAILRDTAESGILEQEPDVSLAQPIGREPTNEEVARLEAVVGSAPAEVIRRLGQPSHVGPHWHYAEVWTYPWGDPTAPRPHKAARVFFRNGVAVQAVYDHMQTGVAEDVVEGQTGQ